MKFLGVAAPLVALFGASFGFVACKDEKLDTNAYAEAWSTVVCDAVVACNCEYPFGVLYPHCLAQLEVNGTTLAELNSVEGLSFDGACAQKQIDAVEALGCGVPMFDPDAECESPCKPWHGPMGKGATCTEINGFDNCKQGLSCSSGVCVDPCAKPDLPQLGEACDVEFGCVEGLYCDGETTPLFPTCATLPTAGMPCIESDFFGYLCAEDLVCDTSDLDAPVCTTLPLVGEECLDGSCGEGLFCDTNAEPRVCAELPTLGEDCPLGSCASPYACEEGSCVQPPPQVCGLYGGLPEGADTTGADSGGDTSGDTGVGTGPLDTGIESGGTDTGIDTGTLGDCCAPADTPGCTDATIAACVCQLDSTCCTDAWTENCVLEVASFECGVC